MEITWFVALIFLLLFLPILRRRKNLPPSPFPSIPLLGHLHLLKHPLHHSFHNLSQKLGPIFSLYLGNRFVVVVSSPTLVQQCFTTNDVVLANRPRLIMGKYIGYNYTSLVNAPYGHHWRNLRRLATIQVFSTARLNSFQSIRQHEILQLLKRLHHGTSNEFTTVELRTPFFDLTLNNVMRMVAGKRYFGADHDDEDEARRFRLIKDKIVAVAGEASPADFFPLLKLIDFKGYENNLKKVIGDLNDFLQLLIDECRRSNNSNTMIDHLLSLHDQEPELYTDYTIKGIIAVMLLAGTDTSAVTIEWAMSALLNNPDKLNKARAEIDKVVGTDRLINELDINNLPYLQNIISETLRLFPAAPLLVPHEASADCKIGGYDIPKGTMLMVNAWSIHRDPTLWEDPTSFNPERFENGEGEVKLLAFGMGRRSCPGNGLATRTVTLAVGSLIQGFMWEITDESMVDLSIGKGVSMSKATPLEAKCMARDVLLKVLAKSN